MMHPTDPEERKSKVEEAKLNLQNSGAYDIMRKVLRNILDERPARPAMHLGQTIEKMTKAGGDNADAIDGEPDEQGNGEKERYLAEMERKLFEPLTTADTDINEEDDENGISILPDLQQLHFFFEQCGVGLGRAEWMRIYFALKQLCDPLSRIYPSVASCRFWGKIIGLEQNYYIAEVTLINEEDDDDSTADNDSTTEDQADDINDDSDNLPQSTFKPEPKVPNEEKGAAGTNKYIYYVVNDLGQEWTRLPSVSPAHITAARSVIKFFTGKLDTNIHAFPDFTGEERHLLRAQIARISAGTIIAPEGFYEFEDDDEADDENNAMTEFVENAEFGGVPIPELVDDFLPKWVHSRLPILNQGRCLWWNPKETEEENEDYDDDADEPRDDVSEPEPEIGKPLLTPICEDHTSGLMPPWSGNINSPPGLMPESHCIAAMKSNLWPGAMAFSNGRRFENIYIGYGAKYSTDNFSPQACQMFDNECKEPEMIEVADPTVGEEHALARERAAEQEEADAEDEEDED